MPGFSVHFDAYTDSVYIPARLVSPPNPNDLGLLRPHQWWCLPNKLVLVVNDVISLAVLCSILPKLMVSKPRTRCINS